MRLNKEKRAELRALAEKATAGPWHTDGDPRAGMEGNVFVNCAPGVTVCFPAIDPDNDEWSQSNMDFIAASRQALPDALADLDELEARVKELERKHREQTEYAWGFEAKLADAVKALEEAKNWSGDLTKLYDERDEICRGMVGCVHCAKWAKHPISQMCCESGTPNHYGQLHDIDARIKREHDRHSVPLEVWNILSAALAKMKS